MTNYSENPGMVRVDFFKPSGKWYTTEAVDMSGFYNTPLIQDAVRGALQAAGKWRPGFTMVVLEPYHQHEHPVMFPAREDS